MEEINGLRKRSRKIVLPVIVIICVFGLLLSIYFGWPSWVAAYYIADAAFCTLLTALLGNDHPVGCILISIMAWAGVVIYAFYSGSVVIVMPSIFLSIFVLSLYENKNVNLVGFIAITFVLVVLVIILNFDAEDPVAFKVSEFAALYGIYYIVMRRLHQTKLFTKKLTETVGDLEEAQSAKDNFLANVSHELRTPLNTIVGISGDLISQELPPESREDVYDILVAGRNLTFLVSDIVDFSELESRQVTLNDDTYSLSSVINDLVNMIEAWNSEKHLDIVIDIANDIPERLSGDSQKIYRVLMNLMNNAVKFTNQGGVLLSFSWRKEAYGGNLCVEVTDTGIGMSEAEIRKLNDIYNQAETGSARFEGGVGLGLPIARKLTARMSGFLHVESVKGEGSTFSFVVPQKVIDDSSIVSIRNPENKKVIFFTDISKFSEAKVRDWYISAAQHMSHIMKIPFVRTGSVTELKRRTAQSRYTHIFTGTVEYSKNRELFANLAQRSVVTVLADPDDRPEDLPPEIRLILKPFHIFSVASVLNGRTAARGGAVKKAPGEEFQLAGVKVLVVDDSPMNLKVVDRLLSRYGISIDTANGGEESVMKARNRKYDLIFMDHMMPGMDGVQALNEIRTLPGNSEKEVPIVALTANAVGGAREMLIGEGFQDFVAKPIEVSQMERVLRKYLGGKIVSAEGGQQMETVKEDFKNGVFPQPDEKLIDVEEGLDYSGGSMADYTEILAVYMQESVKKKKTMDDALAEKDAANYRIAVHSLKSASKTIGADTLSEEARISEKAASSGDLAEVERRHRPLMALYDDVLSAVSRFLKANAEESAAQDGEAQIEGEVDAAALEGLLKAAEAFDQAEALKFLDRLPEEDFASVRESIESFDFEQAIKALGEYGKKAD